MSQTAAANAHASNLKETPPTQPDDRSRISHRGLRYLGLIIAAGLVIRLLAGFLQPAFADEAYVYYVTKAGLNAIFTELRVDTHPPTFNLLAYPLVQLTGSIFLLRLPTILLSVATMFLSFVLARRLCSENTSLVICACLTFNSSIWITDAQLRSYGPLTLGFILLWLGLLDIHAHGQPFLFFRRRAVQTPEQAAQAVRWRWLAFALIAIVTVSLHMMALLVLAACAISAFSFPAPARRRVWLSLALATLPLLAWVVWSRTTCEFEFTRPQSTAPVKVLFNTPLAMLGGWNDNAWIRLGDLSTEALSQGPMVVLLYIVLNGILWLFWLKSWHAMAQDRRWEANMLGFAWGLPLISLYAANLLGLLSYQPRYLMPMCAPFLILLSQGLGERCWRGLSRSMLALAIITALTFPFCKPLWNQYWQSTFDFIASQQRQDDLIAVHIPYACYSVAMAYDGPNISFIYGNQGQSNVMVKQEPNPGKLQIIPIGGSMLSPDFNRFLDSRRIFLILSQYDDSTPALIRWIDERYRVLSTFHQPSLADWADVHVLLLEPKT